MSYDIFLYSYSVLWSYSFLIALSCPLFSLPRAFLPSPIFISFSFWICFLHGLLVFLSLSYFSLQKDFQVPSILQQRTWFGFSLSLNKTSLYIKTTFLYPSHLSVESHLCQLCNLVIVGTAILSLGVGVNFVIWTWFLCVYTQGLQLGHVVVLFLKLLVSAFLVMFPFFDR